MSTEGRNRYSQLSSKLRRSMIPLGTHSTSYYNILAGHENNVPSQIHPDSPNGRPAHISLLICTESASGRYSLSTQGGVAHPTIYISHELSGGRPL